MMHEIVPSLVSCDPLNWLNWHAIVAKKQSRIVLVGVKWFLQSKARTYHSVDQGLYCKFDYHRNKLWLRILFLATTWMMPGSACKRRTEGTASSCWGPSDNLLLFYTRRMSLLYLSPNSAAPCCISLNSAGPCCIWYSTHPCIAFDIPLILI